MQPKTKTILFIIFSFFLGVFCGVLISFNLFVPKKPLTHAEFIKMFQEHVRLSDVQLAMADSLVLEHETRDGCSSTGNVANQRLDARTCKSFAQPGTKTSLRSILSGSQ